MLRAFYVPVEHQKVRIEHVQLLRQPLKLKTYVLAFQFEQKVLRPLQDLLVVTLSQEKVARKGLE